MKNPNDLEYHEFLNHVRSTLDKHGLSHVYDAMLDHSVYTSGKMVPPRLNKSALARAVGMSPQKFGQVWKKLNRAVEVIRETYDNRTT